MGLLFWGSQYAGTIECIKLGSLPFSAPPFTFCCWANAVDFTLGQGFLMLEQGTAGANDFYQVYTYSTPKLSALDNAAVAVSGNSATNGAWNHFAAVYTSRSSRTAYVNGTNPGSDATASTPALTPTGIFVGGDLAGNNCINTQIAFPALWKIALSATDVASLSNGASPRKTRPDQLVSYGRMIGTVTSPEPDHVVRAGWANIGFPIFAANPRMYYA